MFTINPLNGSWNELVIEAVRGLAEPLVSGEVSPHYYVIRRPRRVRRLGTRLSIRVLRKGTPPLQTYSVLSEEGGIEERPLSPALRGRSVLSERDLGRLARLGLKVERDLGAPQDIEWAITPRGDVVVLQSRPITATSNQRSTSPLYTRRFIGERWSEPPSVLGWSIVAPIIENLVSYPEVSE